MLSLLQLSVVIPLKAQTPSPKHRGYKNPPKYAVESLRARCGYPKQVSTPTHVGVPPRSRGYPLRAASPSLEFSTQKRMMHPLLVRAPFIASLMDRSSGLPEKFTNNDKQMSQFISNTLSPSIRLFLNEHKIMSDPESFFVLLKNCLICQKKNKDGKLFFQSHQNI